MPPQKPESLTNRCSDEGQWLLGYKIMYDPIPDNITVEDDALYLDGKEMDADHADFLAEHHGFIDEGDVEGLGCMKQFLARRQANLRYEKGLNP